MFRKNKNKDIDVEGVNEIISISKKILHVGFALAVIALILLVLNILKALNIVSIIKDLLVVISPVFIGLVIAWLFDPLVKFLTKKKIPRILSCILVYLVFIGGLTLLFVLIIPSFVDQVKDFIGAIPGILSDSKKFISGIVNSFSNNHGIELSGIKAQIFSNLESIGNGLTTNLPNILISFAKSLVSGGMFVILGIMIGFYMLYDFDKLNEHFIRILPKSWKSNAEELMSRVNHSLRGYVSGVLLVMLLVFITQSICLSIIGLKAPLVFALFCALTDVIPYFGPYIGAIPAVLVGFTISPLTGIFCIVAIVIVQLLENNFYQPLIMGHAMKLHPVTIILGLLIFEHFFGIIGMIVATPVIATFKVIFTFIDEKVELVKKIQNELDVDGEK